MNRFLAASVMGLLLFAILATGVYFYQRYSIILLDPIRAVPADAAIILELKNPAESLEDFFSGEFRKNLSDDQWLATAEKSFLFFDSLLNENGAVSEIWEDHSLVISTHQVNAGSFDFLYLTNLPRGWTEQKLKHFIEEEWRMPDQFRKREYENVNIYESRLNDSTLFTFASSKSVSLFSLSPLLVEQAIRQLKDGGSVTQTKAFLQVVPPASENASIHIYLNNQSLKEIATSISPDSDNEFFGMASDFARWNGFSLESESGYLSLTGNSVTFDTSSSLAFFRNQKVQQLNADAIAPSRTAFMYDIGLSSFSDYNNHLKSNSGFTLSGADRKKVLNDLQEKFGLSFEASFTSWIGNEMALIITEPAGVAFDNNVYACIKALNPADANNQLNILRDAVAKQAGMVPAVEKYREYPISTINVKGIIPLIYGKIFSGLTGCSYTVLDGFIIFSNRNASLKSLLDDYDEAKTLSKNLQYRNATNHLKAAGNLRMYVNPQLSLNLYRPSILQSFLSTIYRSTGIHAQWNYEGTAVHAHLLFDFHKKKMKEPVILWSAQLDTILASGTVAVKEKDGNTFIYVQDAKYSLYKFDASGNLLWKKNMEEKILSEIIPADIYHDGRQLLLFNTPTKLYLLDPDGKNAGHYPIRLPAGATNGCTVIKTSNSYHIYVACSNHYIYAYEAGGKPVPDWNYLHTKNTVSKPLQAFTVAQKSYLAISDDSGAVIVTDRKGNQITSFAEKFCQSINGQGTVYKNDSIGNTEWITTDTSGNIIIFSSEGNIKKIETGDFTPAHQFYFREAGIMPEPALIFFDNSSLFLLSDDGEIVLTKAMPGFTTLHSAIQLPDGSQGLLVSSPASDLFSIVNSEGVTEKGFPLKGSINPVLTQLHRQVIICGNKSGMLYCYKME